MATQPRTCANCGARLAKTAKFCPQCATPVEAAAPPPPPTATPTPGAPPTPPAAAAPPSGYLPPPGAPSPGSGKKIALVGGIVGAVVIAAVATFFVVSKDEPAPVPPGPEPTVPMPPTPEPPTPPPSPPPDDGTEPPSDDLTELVQEQVGEFSLAEVTRDQNVIAAGATDALVMTYESATGATVTHAIDAWPSQEKALELLQIGVTNLTTGDDPLQVVEEFEVTIEGTAVGRGVLLRGNGEVVVWTNGRLRAAIFADEGVGVTFFQALPY